MNLRRTLATPILLTLAAAILSCGSTNPNTGRVLTGISVSPENADALHFANGQVVFTATGTFSLPPLTAPLTFAAPYSGQFVVNNPSTGTIATIVTSGSNTVTVECVSGATGMASVTASAAANNGTSLQVSGNAQLTCP